MKSPLTYYGGKATLAPEIVPRLHAHARYVEPFCGGAAIFFAKRPAEMETLNDTNGELINFYRIVQHDFIALEKRIQITLHSRDEHRKARVINNNPDMFPPLERAWAVWVLSQQSFSAMLDGSFGYDMNGQMARKVAAKRETFTWEYARRLQNVQLECTDAIKVIRTYDTAQTLFYCDPPYYNSDCGHYDGYTLEDYTALLEALSRIEGKFMLSSYPSPALAEYTARHGWRTKTYALKVSVSAHGPQKDKVEVVTANYELEKQYDLGDLMTFNLGLNGQESTP